MSPVRVALLVVLTSWSAGAGLPSDAPVRDPEALPWQHYVVPAFEGAALSLGLNAFSNLVTRMPFAKAGPEAWKRNLRLDAWTVDVDYYLTNQFGHAYQGSWVFNAARSSGLNFWWSGLYTLVNSLAWELFFEAEPPSVNDQITTPIAGSLFGEAVHRAARQMRRGSAPGWVKTIGATILDPMGALNGELFEENLSDDEPLDPLFVRWQLGASASMVVDRDDQVPRDRTPLQGLIAVLLVSGAPWDSRSTYDAPLSYFDLRADLSFPFKVVGNVFIRGLLSGIRFESPGGALQGVWGLFGDYDYAAAAIVRASAVGLGPGVIFQLQPGARWYLQVGAMLGASPFAAAGQLLDVSPDEGRDYHVGPGVQSNADLRLLRPGWLELELSARNWIVAGAYTLPSGFESITYVTVGANVPVWRWVGAGVELTLADRRASFVGDESEDDTGFSFRATLSLLSEPLFGIAPQK